MRFVLEDAIAKGQGQLVLRPVRGILGRVEALYHAKSIGDFRRADHLPLRSPPNLVRGWPLGFVRRPQEPEFSFATIDPSWHQHLGKPPCTIFRLQGPAMSRPSEIALPAPRWCNGP